MSNGKTKPEKPTRGLLDYIDITIGRVSDSDSTQPGKRKRSWGATVMLLCAIPAFVLVLAVAFATVYSSIRTPTVAVSTPKKSVGKGGKPVKTKPIKIPSVGKATNYIDWPIVGLAALILCVGVAFALIRREQDLKRALKIGTMAAEIKNGSSSGTMSNETHNFLETTIQSALSKVTGDTVKEPELPGKTEEPVIAEPDEWAERKKGGG